MNDWPELVISVAGLRHRDNLADLKRRSSADSFIEVDAVVQAHGLAITTSRIPDGADVHVRATIEADLSGLEVRGTVESAWEGECRRCLELVTSPITLDIDVVFLAEERVASQDDSVDEADAYSFTGDAIDLGEVVREELMLALPLSPLCREDCEGVDPMRFSTDETPGGEGTEEAEPPIDPRWAALSELTFDEE